MKYAFANWRCDGINANDLVELSISEEDLDIINSWLDIEECEIVPESEFEEGWEDKIKSNKVCYINRKD